MEAYDLCTKLCDLYKSQSACFQYTIKNCLGACIGEEATESYNARVQQLIDGLTLNGESFYIIDKGRQRSEKSLILVENGGLTGMGYAPFHFKKQPPQQWKTYLDIMPDDRDARTILNLFLRKNDKHQIVTL